MPALYSHFYRVVQDLQGNAVREVQGTITLAGSATLATLYADPEGLTPLPNPLVNHAEYGSFSVYLSAGRYDMTFTKEAYVFEPLEDILIPAASGGVLALQGTPNQVLVSSSAGNVVLSTPQNTDPDAAIQFAHLGLGTPATGHGLTVETTSEFRGTITARDINAWAVVGTTHIVSDGPGDSKVAFHSAVQSAGGTNRWTIYASGNAPSYLAGNLTVAGGTFLSTLNVASNVGISGSLTVSGHSGLQNVTTLRLGIAYPAPSNVWCRSGALSADIIGVNVGDVIPSYALQVHGTAYINSPVGMSRGPVAPWALCLGGASSLYADGTIQSAGTVDAGLLNVRYAGSTLGAVNAGYWLNVGNLYSAAGIYAVSTVDCHLLTVRSGNSFFTGGVGIGWANEAGYWLTTPNIKTGAITWTDTSTGGFLNLGGDINTANVLAGLNGYKPGGGDWAASSSRHLKRNIAPIPDALGVLLAQRGRVYEWDEPTHAALLPGPRYGFVYDEVTIDQWRTTAPDGSEALAIQGAEALIVEALRQIVVRLEALGG